MKTLLVSLLSTLAVFALSGCGETRARTTADAPEPAPAASFKPGYGLRLTALGREFIGLATAEFAGRLPPAARLRTVEGDFVYVASGPWLIRTPVSLGALDERGYDVREGLYEGDVIVTSAVQSLWLAELHFLRAGQACAHDDGG